MFKNKRYSTAAIAEEIPFYLQVFKLSEYNGMQRIVHSQEEPEYTREYLINTGTPFFNAKIYVIDSVEYSTMLFSHEY